MKRKHLWYWVVILLVSIVPLIDLFHPGLPVTHDGQDHVARIANFYQSLSEGNIVPRWAGNLNWGYGHPVVMFLYPLPSYIASLFHVIGFSLVDSTKLVFAVAFIASMLGMYLWASAAWGRWAGIAASVFYGFAPYRFVDLYVRGAIGEHMAFVFLPVVLWGLWQVQKRPLSAIGLSSIAFGTAALILSHNALSLMFFPLILLYAIYLAASNKMHRWQFLLLTAVSLTSGFLFAAFFWIPAFFEGKYTLRDIVTAGQFDNRFVPWSWFVYSPWSYGGGDMLSKSLGWAQIVVIVVALAISVRRSKLQSIMWGALAVLFGSLILMTNTSLVVWKYVTILQKFQFPWRFLSISVFAAAVLGGLVVAAAGKKQMAAALVLCTLAVIGTATMWHAKTYKTYPQSFFTGIYDSTTDTGESSPIWSVRFMEHEPALPMYLTDGDVQIRSLFRNSTRHSYEVIVRKPSRLVENTLYFPGWRIYVDGTPVSVQFQDPNYRGLMTFTIVPGTHRVEVAFADTKLRTASDAVSLVSVVLFILVLGTIRLWRKRIYR